MNQLEGVLFLNYIVPGFTNSTELTDDDFISGRVMDENNNINRTWAIKLYLPFCKYCLRIYEDWEHLANFNTNKSLNIGSINCNKYPDACVRFDAGGYPSIYVVENATSYRFTHKRSFQNLKEFIQNGAYVDLGENQELTDYDNIPKTTIGRYLNLYKYLPWWLRCLIILAFIISPSILIGV